MQIENLWFPIKCCSVGCWLEKRVTVSKDLWIYSIERKLFFVNLWMIMTKSKILETWSWIVISWIEEGSHCKFPDAGRFWTKNNKFFKAQLRGAKRLRLGKTRSQTIVKPNKIHPHRNFGQNPRLEVARCQTPSICQTSDCNQTKARMPLIGFCS